MLVNLASLAAFLLASKLATAVPVERASTTCTLQYGILVSLLKSNAEAVTFCRSNLPAYDACSIKTSTAVSTLPVVTSLVTTTDETASSLTTTTTQTTSYTTSSATEIDYTTVYLTTTYAYDPSQPTDVPANRRDLQARQASAYLAQLKALAKSAVTQACQCLLDAQPPCTSTTTKSVQEQPTKVQLIHATSTSTSVFTSTSVKTISDTITVATSTSTITLPVQTAPAICMDHYRTPYGREEAGYISDSTSFQFERDDNDCLLSCQATSGCLSFGFTYSTCGYGGPCYYNRCTLFSQPAASREIYSGDPSPPESPRMFMDRYEYTSGDVSCPSVTN